MTHRLSVATVAQTLGGLLQLRELRRSATEVMCTGFEILIAGYKYFGKSAWLGSGSGEHDHV
jgi:hypothetical protein